MYGFSTHLTMPFDAAVVKVTEALKKEGLLQSEWVILGHFRSLGACK